ncbi:hypothetical protein PISMIDRAFT_674489 [Pisolithus microcarpus 441]|uniref:Uncharacterized protein n=1 Tax=Pisolithus microcarpus 441 TaxID=765257 RepID=A0A0C9ZNP5_9AGAM|nr:hypothetical protein PISMIDRAFT_674489 [Pisolithus microcarpus 441]
MYTAIQRTARQCRLAGHWDYDPAMYPTVRPCALALACTDMTWRDLVRGRAFVRGHLLRLVSNVPFPGSFAVSTRRK